jgi:hypothetical protein
MVGRTYEIRASALDYKPVTGSSYIPVPSSVTKADVTEIMNVRGFPESVIRVTFTDEPSTVNYYQIFLEVEQDRLDRLTGIVSPTRSRLSMETDDPIVQNDLIGYDGIFLKDILFSNGQGSVSFKTSASNTEFYPAIIVTLRTVSADFFNYKISSVLQADISDDPFAQPLNVYKNINNGFGIFAGYSESNFTIGKVSQRPVITTITPLEGKPGDRIIIRGENFGDSFGEVVFNGVQYLTEGSIMRITDNELEVVVPPNARSGRVYVGNGTKIGVSDFDFQVKE